jgi:hypothetical protein
VPGKATFNTAEAVSAQLVQFPAFVGVLQIKLTKKLRAIFSKSDNYSNIVSSIP